MARPTQQSLTATTKVIGLVGGIGAGKSSAAKRLAQLGAVVVDADRIGHEVLSQPDVIAQIGREFGTHVVNAQGVDRKALAQIVFADRAMLDKLESIVHPHLERRLQESLAANRARRVPMIVLDAAIMLEKGWNRFCDQLLFIESPESDRVRRCQEHRGWDEEMLRQREQVQMSVAEKRRLADHVVINNGSLDDFQARVDAWFHRVIETDWN